MPRGSFSIGDLIDAIQRNDEAFGDRVVKTTTNESNLAGHYPYNPERWRLFKGSTASGNRLFPEYDSVPEYNHAGDYHELQPAAGETLIFETAERYRYIVQYVLEATWALAINQPLQSGDYVRCGLYDGADGWFLERNGGHADDAVDIVMLREGSEVYREPGTLGQYRGDLQTNTRIALRTAWYDVTRQEWAQSYSYQGTQRNEEIAKASADDVRGPSKGNLTLRFEVQASPDTDNLVLEAGSAALVTLGSGEDNTRTKAKYWVDPVNDTGTWTPIRAYRERDGYSVVNNQLLSLDVVSFDGDVPIELCMLSFDETNVTFDGTDSWSLPDVWHQQNNAIETRSDVDTFVDDTGTAVTTAANPGGFQIGYATLAPTTGKSFKEGASEATIGAKRNIPNGDVAVLLAYTAAIGDVGHAEKFEQDW